MLDDFGRRIGRAWRETDEQSASRDQLIADLIDGQYSNPVRIVAFNTAQGRSRDVSQELADLIAEECALDGFDIPPALVGFVDRQASRPSTQLMLRLI